jgi:hypothetical protein
MLDSLVLDMARSNFGSPEFESRLEHQIRERLGSIDHEEIQRFVPYRLLRPFLVNETRGLPDWRVNKKIQEYAEASFNTPQPVPYIIVDKEDPCIELHPDWYAYFVRHLKILTDWTDWNFSSYLQRRNPNSPAIASKLYLPKRRQPLLWQRRLWTPVFARTQVRCIYSNEIIPQDQFHLDHYLPWSFVCHNEAWNLVPVAPTVNSAKSNAIPSTKYLSGFIDLQSRALSMAKDHLSSSDWEAVCSSYESGLRIDSSDFLNPVPLRRSIEETIVSLASIAKRMGFSSDWAFEVNKR